MKGLNCRGKIMLVLLATILLISPGVVLSAEYPAKPITLLIPYGPGGITDLTGRTLAEIAKESLGQQIIVVNKGGGGGTLAQAVVAKEKSDGYTLAVTSDVAFTQVPQMRVVPYDPLKDFEYIIGHFQNPGGIVCKTDSQWKTIKDLLAYSKKNPGKVTYGTAGAGGAAHIATEILTHKEGITWQHVPFEGTAKMTTALLGGHVNVGCSDFAVWKSLIQAGDLRVLAVEEAMKHEFPGVPTFEELGFPVGTGASFGIVAPKGTPAPILKKLHDAFKKAMEDPRYDAICKKVGANRTYFSGADYSKKIKEQYAVRGKMLEQLGMKKK